MSLRVGPIPQKCNVSDHGIAPMRYKNANLFIRISRNLHTCVKRYKYINYVKITFLAWLH